MPLDKGFESMLRQDRDEALADARFYRSCAINGSHRYVSKSEWMELASECAADARLAQWDMIAASAR